ncbi:MAG: AAA family ATPase [Polyangiaceae bacterium]|nr:AAA family ATPase [Polyangiaceae bacterium]
MTKWLVPPTDNVQLLPRRGNLPREAHVYEPEAVVAVNAALAAQRPLLVRGEPGTGKSQLAFAVAETMNRRLLTQVIDSRTTACDLLYSFDAVSRLAQAQLLGALRNVTEAQARDKLAEARFVRPGPLWWALNWESARQHVGEFGGDLPEAPAGRGPENGVVVLIDEIDKGDSDVPNGLLEVLGAGQFRPCGLGRTVVAEGTPPLVVITTNEERALPDAFVRRCFVLPLALPELPAEEVEFTDRLMARGRAHCRSAAEDRNAVDEDVLREAARLLIQDRIAAQKDRLPAPGQAEYLDLVRAVSRAKSEREAQLAVLREIAPFALKKHPRERPISPAILKKQP